MEQVAISNMPPVTKFLTIYHLFHSLMPLRLLPTAYICCCHHQLVCCISISQCLCMCWVSCCSQCFQEPIGTTLGIQTVTLQSILCSNIECYSLQHNFNGGSTVIFLPTPAWHGMRQFWQNAVCRLSGTGELRLNSVAQTCGYYRILMVASPQRFIIRNDL